jgi:hypothetical protein
VQIMHSKPKIKDTIPGITKALVVLFLIAGVMSLNPKPASAVTENVVWTSLVNATASGNTITDTSSVAEGGGVSSQSITSGDGYVEFTVAGIDGNRAAGLNSNSSNQTLEEIDYAMSPTMSLGLRSSQDKLDIKRMVPCFIQVR